MERLLASYRAIPPSASVRLAKPTSNLFRARAKRTAVFTIQAPTGVQPTDIAGIEAAGEAWYPLALARELDDAILEMRTNELDIGIWLMKTRQ